MKLALRSISASPRVAGPAVRAVLQDLSLSIEAGEQVAVIGPSGAGKTTLLHLMACAVKPTSGSLMLDGHDVWQQSHAQLQHLRGKLFLAPQVPPLPPRQPV